MKFQGPPRFFTPFAVDVSSPDPEDWVVVGKPHIKALNLVQALRDEGITDPPKSHTRRANSSPSSPTSS